MTTIDLRNALARHASQAAVLAACLVSAGALAACGSNSGNGGTLPGGGTSSTTTASPGGTTSPSGGGTPTTGGSTSGSGLSALQSKIQAGENSTFEATYKVLSGSSTTSMLTIAQSGSQTYFGSTDTDGSKTDLIGSSSTTAYVCSESPGSSSWNCIKYPASEAASLSTADEFYSGKYWITELRAIESSEAALAGVHVSNSTMSLNGINLTCVTWSATKSGQQESAQWCVTDQGVLGYVKTSGGGTNGGFEIQSYSSSPAASLFQIPQGATVTST